MAAESTLVSEIQQRYRANLGAASEHRQKRQECREFTNGEVYTDEQKDKFAELGLPPVSVPLVETVIDQAVSFLTSRQPQFEVYGFDDSDVEMAKSWSMFLSYIWQKSKGDHIHRQVVRNRYERGAGYKMLYFDPAADFGRGDLRIANADPDNVLVAANSTDPFHCDASSMQYAKEMTANEFFKLHPLLDRDFLEDVSAQQSSELTPNTRLGGSYNNSQLAVDRGDTYAHELNAFDKDDKTYLYVEDYQKVTKIYHRVLDTRTGEEEIFSEEAYQEFLLQPTILLVTDSGAMELKDGTDPDQVADVLTEQGIEFSMDVVTRQKLFELGLYDSAPFPLVRIQRTCIVGDKLVREPHILPISEYPIVPYYYKHLGSPFTKSPVEFAMQPARIYNRLLMLGMAYVANTTGVKVWVPKGSVEDTRKVEEGLLKPTFVGEYEPGTHPPTQMAMQSLPNSIQSWLADMKHKIEYVFGVFEGMMGNSALAPETVRGGLLVDQQGQRRMKSHQQEIEAADSHLGCIAMEWSQTVYTAQKQFRVLNPDGGSETRQILADNWAKNVGGMNKMLQTTYDVVVKAGSSLPINREQEEQIHFRNYQADLIPATQYLKKTNLYNLEEVLEEQSLISQLRSAVEAQAKKIKNLEGDLQTATRESVNDRKRLEVNDFEVELDKLMNDLKAKGMVADSQMKMLMSELQKLNSSNKSLDSPEEQAAEAIDRQDGSLAGSSVE